MSSVIVIGGGLSGLAATVGLASRGYRVTLLEARPRLGGRASSFTDPATGELVDACQHVSMGCCTNFLHFCRTLGVDYFLEAQPTLYFITPDGRMSRFKSDPWPAPFHLSRALLGAHYLTPVEKLRIVYGVGRMLLEPPSADPPLLEWLLRHRQTPRTIDRFWSVILTSALNETVDRVGLKYARKVFRDGFVRHRDGFTVSVPRVPLARFYGVECQNWLEQHGVEIRLDTAVRQLLGGTDSRIEGVQLRDGTVLTAEAYVVAVPFERFLGLLPERLRTANPEFDSVSRMTPSPISSVHLWFDRPVLTLPHAVLIDGLGEWVFNRGKNKAGGWYVQVVVSAARPLRELGRDGVVAQVREELERLFPAFRSAELLRSKVVTEHAATFSAVPGVDAFRPAQRTKIKNLAIAGDWTATGWPATMEGAVRGGYLAAEAILEMTACSERLLQPDL